MKGAIPIISAASTSHIGARIALFNDSATPANYLTARQATPAVTAKPVATAAAAATAVGATNSCPPLDSATTLDTKCGPCTRIVIADSGQDDAVGTTKAVTADVCKNAGGKEFGTRADVRTASVAATATIIDSPRKRPAPGGDLGRLLRVLRGLGDSDGPSRELPLPTPPPALRRTPSQGEYQLAVSGVPDDRNRQRGRQDGVPSAHQ